MQDYALKSHTDVFQFCTQAAASHTNIDCSRENNDPILMSDIQWMQLVIELPLPGVKFIFTFKQANFVDSWELI